MYLYFVHVMLSMNSVLFLLKQISYKLFYIKNICIGNVMIFLHHHIRFFPLSVMLLSVLYCNNKFCIFLTKKHTNI